MAKPQTDNEKILGALNDLNKRLDDVFVLLALRAGIKGHEIRAILGIEMARVTRIVKHAKKGE